MNIVEVPQIRTLINRILLMGELTIVDEPLVLTYKSGILPPVNWDAAIIESMLTVTLPQELDLFWAEVEEVFIKVEQNYGQDGFKTISPNRIVDVNQFYQRDRPNTFRKGDLVVGIFKGLQDLLLMRCDPNSNDFGDIVIRLPIDPSHKWPTVGHSLVDFCDQYIQRSKVPFWPGA